MSRAAANPMAVDSRTLEEAKPILTTRLATAFGQPKKLPVERAPLDPETKALIANLMAMR
jgi:hypothetical protein